MFSINVTQIKCLAVFSVFAIIGFGPISPGCLIGMTIVLVRPQWFLTLIENMYASLAIAHSPEQSLQSRIKCFCGLLTLFIIDILPVPVTPVIAFVIILARPAWFYRLVLNIYG